MDEPEPGQSHSLPGRIGGGYLGHALLTFREETGGRQFARRWLLLQYVVNLSVCALLPLLKAPTLALVFTPRC